MPGKIVNINITDGQCVKPGDVLVVLFSMKMEHKLLSQKEGKVRLFVKQDEIVAAGQTLLSVE